MGTGVLVAVRMDLIGSDETRALLAAAAVLLAFAAWLWAVLAVRCPSCGARLFWRAISEHGIVDWLTWLESLSSCPDCGDAGEKGLRRASVAWGGNQSTVTTSGIALVVGLGAKALVDIAGIVLYRVVSGDLEPQGVGMPGLAVELLSWLAGSSTAAACAVLLAKGSSAGAAIGLATSLLVVNALYFVPGPWPSWFRLANVIACLAPVWVHVLIARVRRTAS